MSGSSFSASRRKTPENVGVSGHFASAREGEGASCHRADDVSAEGADRGVGRAGQLPARHLLRRGRPRRRHLGAAAAATRRRRHRRAGAGRARRPGDHRRTGCRSGRLRAAATPRDRRARRRQPVARRVRVRAVSGRRAPWHARAGDLPRRPGGQCRDGRHAAPASARRARPHPPPAGQRGVHARRRCVPCPGPGWPH